MLLLLAFALLTCRPPAAAGFLDECPIDKELRYGDARVVDILETFYKDLEFVGACTEARQGREYSAVVQEISDLATDPARDVGASVRAYRLFSELLRALSEDRPETAQRLVHENGGAPFIRDWVENYFYYLQAETSRLHGDLADATRGALWALLERTKFAGVSMDRLERLDGLLALQQVSQVNADLDRLYGLRASPNYRLLRLVHFVFRHELAPLEQVSLAIYDKLFREPPVLLAANASALPPGYDVERLEPAMDDFSGHSVARWAAEGTLCEFAQKFDIVADERDVARAPDYAAVMDQLRRLDARLAHELDVRVVQHIGAGENPQEARRAVGELWREYNSPPYTRDNTRGIFVAYLHIELNFLQAPEGCNVWELDSLRFAYDFILKDLRKQNAGLSLGRLALLEARLALHWVQCFHERVKLAYGLDGADDERLMRAKRAQVGASCARTVPQSDLLRYVPAGDGGIE